MPGWFCVQRRCFTLLARLRRDSLLAERRHCLSNEYGLLRDSAEFRMCHEEVHDQQRLRMRNLSGRLLRKSSADLRTTAPSMNSGEEIE